MLIHWVVLITALALGTVHFGVWLHARRNARQELKQRGWVCIDLPSPDTPRDLFARGWRRRPFIATAHALAPVTCIMVTALVTVWMLLSCTVVT